MVDKPIDKCAFDIKDEVKMPYALRDQLNLLFFSQLPLDFYNKILFKKNKHMMHKINAIL